MGSATLLVLFMGPIILFQLTFAFIYSIFRVIFQFQQNKRYLKSKHTLKKERNIWIQILKKKSNSN